MITLHTVVKFIVYMLHVHCYAQLCQSISQPSYTRSFPVLERVLNVELRSLANFVSKFFALINLSFSNQKTQHDFNQQTQNQAPNHLEAT